MNWLLSNLNNIGLILDIIGALMIFLDSPKVSFETRFYRRKEQDGLNKKAKRINNLAKIGALILFIGFLLQFIYNLTK